MELSGLQILEVKAPPQDAAPPVATNSRNRKGQKVNPKPASPTSIIKPSQTWTTTIKRQKHDKI